MTDRTTTGMSRGRVNPVDLALQKAGKGPTSGQHIEADKDYTGNLKKFHRTDDMSAEPTRKSSREQERK